MSIILLQLLISQALFEGHSSNGKGVISCVCFVGSGDQILVGSSEGLVRLWDTETTSPLKLFQVHVYCTMYL